MTKLRFDINIVLDINEEQAEKLELYYEERVPELTVIKRFGKGDGSTGFYFNKEFVEVLRQKYMYEIKQEIKSIIN
tara:strand:- start:1008 stop:1235 length:228 start_codon:yes stop_codon:yes gene_type:complete